MADNGDAFPEASLHGIMNKIKAPAARYPSLMEYVTDLVARLDKNQDKMVDWREFGDGLRQMGINVTNHEQHSLMRRFDVNGDGRISMQEFYDTLAKEF